MLNLLVLLGGLTTHPFNPEFKQSVAPMGTILNPYSIIALGSDTSKLGFIMGQDSMKRSISGPIYVHKLHDNISFVGGFYNDNGHNRIKFNVIDRNYVPMIGVNIQFKMYESDRFSIESHNLISVITTHSVGINFKF